jgi:putative FmdB family regulatory protein
MPTYEYRCPAGHDFEHFYRTISSAESTRTCPVCGEVGERRLSGGSGLVFKGSGFYITDYGEDGKKDQRKAAGKSESGGSSGEGGASSGERGGSSGEGSGSGERSGSSGERGGSSGERGGASGERGASSSGGDSKKSADKPAGGSGGSE